MKERVRYKLLTILGGKNPRECQITEEFRGDVQTLARVVMENVPKKPIYVILRQEKDYFPEVIDACVNIKCASNKVLEHSLRYIQKRIENEGNPLLIESVIDNCTVYEAKRFRNIEKRLEKI